MRRGSIFWGFLLIAIGGLFLLDSLGVLRGVNLWDLIWPTFLILLGVWAILGYLRGRQPLEVEMLSLPLEGAQQAKVRVKYGAGRLRIGAGAPENDLVEGQFGGGVVHRLRREADRLTVDLTLPWQGFPVFVTPWNWGRLGGYEWSLSLNGEVPMKLEVDTGASEARIDLTDLHVTDLKVNTGASSTELTLPAHAGYTKVDIDAGAASVGVKVPSGVAARIQAGGALAGIKVDANRFPRQGGFYQSPDYESSENKVEVKVDVGVGSIAVR